MKLFGSLENPDESLNKWYVRRLSLRSNFKFASTQKLDEITSLDNRTPSEGEPRTIGSSEQNLSYTTERAFQSHLNWERTYHVLPVRLSDKILV